MVGLADDDYIVKALLADFPFLREIRDYVAQRGLRLEDFEGNNEYIAAAVEKVEEALLKWPSKPVTRFRTSEVEIFSHPLAMALIAMLESPFAKRRFAAYEAERYVSMLKNIREEQKKVIAYVAREVLGFRIREDNPPYEFWIHFADYLKVAVDLNEPRFRLVNRLLDKGYVAVTRAEALTLVKNGMEKLIHQRLEKMGRIAPPPFLAEYVEQLRKKLEASRQRESTANVRLEPERWPPCMQALRNRLLSGESVSHFGNFAIAAFMLRIGMTVEEVMSVYMQRGDFDPKIARYQVEHIAGLKGSRTKYSVPKCVTMQTHGLCIEDGKLCGGVKNPMQYYRKMAMRKTSKQEKEEEKS
uniref:DNA primase large subunit PriL n=1 Tax=Caldiarchaeum subterraneum TaxID=311458 RepID=A0A7C5U3P3_CALS0